MNYPFERKTSHTLTRMICIAAAAVLMYLLVLRGEKFLNHYWGVRA